MRIGSTILVVAEGFPKTPDRTAQIEQNPEKKNVKESCSPRSDPAGGNRRYFRPVSNMCELVLELTAASVLS